MQQSFRIIRYVSVIIQDNLIVTLDLIMMQFDSSHITVL